MWLPPVAKPGAMAPGDVTFEGEPRAGTSMAPPVFTLIEPLMSRASDCTAVPEVVRDVRMAPLWTVRFAAFTCGVATWPMMEMSSPVIGWEYVTYWFAAVVP